MLNAAARAALIPALPCTGLLVVESTRCRLPARSFTETRTQRAFESASRKVTARRMDVSAARRNALLAARALRHEVCAPSLPVYTAPLQPTQFDAVGSRAVDLRWAVASLAATIVLLIAAVHVAG